MAFICLTNLPNYLPELLSSNKSLPLPLKIILDIRGSDKSCNGIITSLRQYFCKNHAAAKNIDG